MLIVEQIAKFRDEHGNIIGYRLRDFTPNRRTQDVKADILKREIRAGNVTVTNLTLTSNNRLVDTSSNGLESRKLGPKPDIKNSNIEINKKTDLLTSRARLQNHPGMNSALRVYIADNEIAEMTNAINDTNVKKSIDTCIKYINEHPEQQEILKKLNPCNLLDSSFVNSLFVMYILLMLSDKNDTNGAQIITKPTIVNRAKNLVGYSNLPNCKKHFSEANREQLITVAKQLAKYAPAVCDRMSEKLGEDITANYLYRALAEVCKCMSIPVGAASAVITIKGKASKFITRTCVKHDSTEDWYNGLETCIFHLGSKLPHLFTEIRFPVDDCKDILIVPHAYIHRDQHTYELDINKKAFKIKVTPHGDKPDKLSDIINCIMSCRKDIVDITRNITSIFEDSVIEVCGGRKAREVQQTGMAAIGNLARDAGLITEINRNLDIRIDTGTDTFTDKRNIEKFTKVLIKNLNTI